MIVASIQSLPAKSAVGSAPPLSLIDHSSQAAEVARLVFNPSTRVGINFCNAFRLTREQQESFFLHLQVAALFHDIGKANSGFIRAVSGEKNCQVIRHEHLSALFMMQQPVRSWLAQNPKLEFRVLLGAVVSHHLKADYRTFADVPAGSLHDAAELFFSHSQVDQILSKIASETGLPAISIPAEPNLFHRRVTPWRELISELLQLENQTRRWLANEESGSSDFRKLLCATRTALIASDSIASGLVREGINIDEWIAKNVHVHRLTGEELRKQVIEPRMERISRQTQQPAQLLPFQQSAAKLSTNSCLVSGCGTGKTLAGLLWACNQLDRAEFGRVLVLYPTRATATEGYRGYISAAPDGESILLHSTAQYDLVDMLENPEEPSEKQTHSERNARLFALSCYPYRYYSATVDQFFGFLSHDYASICRLPVLTDSVVILDEIHSWDNQLFEHALDFLQNMAVPTLCMTATLQPERRDALERAGLEIFPKSSDRELLQDLEAKENHPRYSLRWLPEERISTAVDARVTTKPVSFLVPANLNLPEEIRAAVQTGMQDGSKILWVVNTVSRAQAIALSLRQLFGDKVIVYHSRYKLSDRNARHRDCIDRLGIGTKAGAVIAVTTQVCEMSLDLDSDILITEVAPMESLVQRFGRSNRRPADRPEGFLASLIVYGLSHSQILPYSSMEIAATAELLNELAQSDRPLTQRRLSESILEFSPDRLEPEPSSRLFSTSLFAMAGQLRDIDGFAVPAVLNLDLDRISSALDRGLPINGFVVNVPMRDCISFEGPRPKGLPRHLFLADGARYSAELGFM